MSCSSDLQHQRHVTLDGMTNLRTLGGHCTSDGTKQIKWGVLYRGDQPYRVPADVAQQVLVNALHIRHSVDVRDDSETEGKSCIIPHITRHTVPIDMSRMNELLEEGENVNDGPVAFKLMLNYYRHLVLREGVAVGRVIKTLLRVRPSCDSAVLVHCTAGKDRTGWTMYVVLSLLGVAEKAKREDYMLTNTYFQIPPTAYEYEGAAELSEESFNAFWRVFDAYLDAAVAEVDKLGGMDAYAKSHMGLTDDDIQQLRDLLLEEK